MVKVAVVGAPGYSGAELVDILLKHPRAEIAALYGSARRERAEAARTMADLFPRFRGRCELPVSAFDLDDLARLKPDAVFLATPNEVSHELAPVLRDRGLIVLDLSGAFRLKDASLYPTYYGFEHTAPGLLERAVYGLPELRRDAIAKADIIAVPGCYPTSAILPIAPLARAGAVSPGTRPIVDSISGVSGAGRSPAQKSLFCEVSVQAYNVLAHRHNPEIDAYGGTPVVFTPHLGPYDRGILSTIHVELAEGWNGDRARETLAAAYRSEPFIRLLSPGTWPAVADVRATNFCDIALAADDARRHLIISSAIDNLVKGAAGQAVQCFNLRFGLGETTALGPRRVEAAG